MSTYSVIHSTCLEFSWEVPDYTVVKGRGLVATTYLLHLMKKNSFHPLFLKVSFYSNCVRVREITKNWDWKESTEINST